VVKLAFGLAQWMRTALNQREWPMKIMLAIDGSEDALAAVRLALQWHAQGLRASYVLLNVQPHATLYEVAVAHDAERLRAMRTAAGADLLRPAEERLAAVGIGFESEVAGGEPVRLVLELAEAYGCASVVMGARGRGEASTLGSTVEAVLARASLPVMVVKAPQGAS
jgi:nucleotide-binding universal stress UspA family protein